MHFGYFFGQLVREARKTRGWSQTDLVFHAFEADKGMTPRISEIENGRIAEPKPAIVKAIAKALRISAAKIEECREKARQPFVGTLTFDQHEQNVRERLSALEGKLRESKDDRAVLEQQATEARRRLEDLEADYERTKVDLAEARTLLERYDNQLEHEKVEAAKRALDRGDRTLADALFGEAQAKLTAQADDLVAEAAKLAYERGRIAEDDIRWHDADKHYSEAARLAPTYEHLAKAGTFADKCGDYRRGAHTKEKLVELAEAEFGPEDARTAASLNELAENLWNSGQYSKAESLYRRAMDIAENEFEPTIRLATYLGNLGGCLRSISRFNEAEPLLREAVKIMEALRGLNHPDVAIRLNNLAGLLEDTGRFDEAEPLYRRAIEIGEKALGSEHPDLAVWLNNLANLLRDTGRFDEVEPLYRRALEISEKALGPEHPDTAIDYNNLAGLLRDTGRFDEAEPLVERAVKILRVTLGDDHPTTKIAIENYETFKAERDKS